jgi:hypothetical protein
MDLTPDQARVRLSQVPAERHRLHTDHLARIGPMLSERDQLAAKLARVDDALADEGVRHQDALRELDRLADRLHALLPVGEPEVQDADPNQRQVERILGQMRSGKIRRNDFIASTPEQVAAQDAYDQAETTISGWARMAVQTKNATGHIPDLPDAAKGFDRQLLADICARAGLLL